MTLLPLAAGIGIEGVIWIIILIFWSIAQYVQKSRAAQRRPPLRPGQPPPPPARPPTEIETELQDLLRELTGQPPIRRAELPEEEEVEDLPEPETPPVRRVQPPPPPPPAARPVRTPPQVLARKVSAAPPPPRAPAWQPEIEPPVPLRPPVTEISDGMVAAFAHSGKMPGLTLSMKGLNIKAMALPSSSPSRRGGGSASFRLSSLRDPRTLRQMVIARAILDKPKSMEASPGF